LDCELVEGERSTWELISYYAAEGNNAPYTCRNTGNVGPGLDARYRRPYDKPFSWGRKKIIVTRTGSALLLLFFVRRELRRLGLHKVSSGKKNLGVDLPVSASD
jgi:hypothetical protein